MIVKMTLLLFSVFFFHVEAQDDPSSQQPSFKSFNLALAIGILSILFSVAFLLMAYAKLCQSALFGGVSEEEEQEAGAGDFQRSSSGIERSIIESLPFFTFSSLKGAKQDLECAVCLSKFEDAEVLRLLPYCKHAFHINCIDKWLESHSSCPLCRCKFDAARADLKSLSVTDSLRYPRNSSNLSEEPVVVELLVQREQEDNNHQSSFGFNRVDGSLLNKFGLVEYLIPKGGYSDRNVLHKLKHKIVVSDLIHRSRWSDVQSSDLMFSNSEMLNAKSSQRLSSDEFIINVDILKVKEDLERKRILYDSKVSASTSNVIGPTQTQSKLRVHSGDHEKRSMSEIINISRFMSTDHFMSARNNSSSTININIINESAIMFSRSGGKDEIMRKLWLPIATRTVQWFAAGREKALDWKRSPWN